jgi:hypothetical protein
MRRAIVTAFEREMNVVIMRIEATCAQYQFKEIEVEVRENPGIPT